MITRKVNLCRTSDGADAPYLSRHSFSQPTRHLAIGRQRLHSRLYRQASQAGGALKLAGVQKRVETMLRMTGVHKFIELHPDESSAVKSLTG